MCHGTAGPAPEPARPGGRGQSAALAWPWRVRRSVAVELPAGDFPGSGAGRATGGQCSAGETGGANTVHCATCARTTLASRSAACCVAAAARQQHGDRECPARSSGTQRRGTHGLYPNRQDHPAPVSRARGCDFAVDCRNRRPECADRRQQCPARATGAGRADFRLQLGRPALLGAADSVCTPRYRCARRDPAGGRLATIARRPGPRVSHRCRPGD